VLLTIPRRPCFSHGYDTKLVAAVVIGRLEVLISSLFT
jgi:hypothetical protein